MRNEKLVSSRLNATDDLMLRAIAKRAGCSSSEALKADSMCDLSEYAKNPNGRTACVYQ